MQARAAKRPENKKTGRPPGAALFFSSYAFSALSWGIAGQAGVVRYPTHSLFQLHSAVPQGQHPCCAPSSVRAGRFLLLPARYHQNVLPAARCPGRRPRPGPKCGADSVFMELCRSRHRAAGLSPSSSTMSARFDAGGGAPRETPWCASRRSQLLQGSTAFTGRAESPSKA